MTLLKKDIINKMSTQSKSSTWSQKQRLREDIIDAVVKGNYSEVESMLIQGADPNEAEGGYLTQKTLLMLAIENDHIDIALLLVQRGADLKATITVLSEPKEEEENCRPHEKEADWINKVTKTVLDFALEKSLDSVVAEIENKNAANNRLLQAVKDNNSSEVQNAINFGANSNILYQDEDMDEDSPEINLLLFAICESRLDAAKILITSEIDLDFVFKLTDPGSGEYSENTARSLAKRMHFTDIVNLIDKEAERRKAGMNGSPKENSRTKNSAKRQKRDTQPDEIEDIEDDEFQEAECEASPTNRQRQPKGGACVIS